MIGESAESAFPVFSDARPAGHALGGKAGKAHERYATKALVRRHGGPPDGMVFAARRETDHAPVRFPGRGKPGSSDSATFGIARSAWSCGAGRRSHAT